MLFSFTLTFDQVCQLDQDTSIALATVREWRNSFIHINRVPLEILSLVPTHLSFQDDRFLASFVCRHWRRAFLRHAALWSQLYLSVGEVYVKTLLERVKGSALDIFASSMDDVNTIRLLLPHTEQIKSLNLADSRWRDIQRLSELNSGPLPLLSILRINTVMMNSTEAMIPSSPPLFNNAVNLQEFSLHSQTWLRLNHFVFPNLTFFELSAPAGTLQALQLLDFLDSSPMLQTVGVHIFGVVFDGVPQERVTILHDVKSFCLVVGRGEAGYKLAAHISCPSAKHTLLRHEHQEETDGAVSQEIFPASVSWNAIIRQYTRSPVEEAALEMVSSWTTVECSLTFRSPDASIRLHFKHIAEDDDHFEALKEMDFEVFSQASRTIQDLTLLTNIKRLHVSNGLSATARITDIAGPLFESVGPLEELILHHCDMQAYLGPFLDDWGIRDLGKLVEFPPIKELTISHPLHPLKFEAAVVGLVESQHALGIPFERVTIRMDCLPAEMAEKLRPWVGTVHCYNEVEPI